MHEHHEHTEHHAMPTEQEAMALLHYTLHHNEHHLEELNDLASALEAASRAEAAAKVRLAASGYAEANRLLEQAYESCSEE